MQLSPVELLNAFSGCSRIHKVENTGAEVQHYTRSMHWIVNRSIQRHFRSIVPATLLVRGLKGHSFVAEHPLRSS